MAQIEAIAAQCHRLAPVSSCSSSPIAGIPRTSDQTVAVIEAINRFVENLDIAVPPAPTF
jgi:hypothetical protein